MGGVEQFVSVGKIVRPHGIGGEVKVISLTDWPERFEVFQSLYMEGEGHRGGWIEVERGRVRGDHVILKLFGIDDRNAAEPLRGVLLKIPEEQCPALPKDVYYIFHLIGLDVRTTTGIRVGSLVDILRMPSQDVYVVDTGEKEVLIPAVKAFVKLIDISKGVVLIEPIEGLLE